MKTTAIQHNYVERTLVVDRPSSAIHDNPMAISPEAVIPVTIGRGLSLANHPTTAVAAAPVSICAVPSSADAVPAMWPRRSIASTPVNVTLMSDDASRSVTFGSPANVPASARNPGRPLHDNACSTQRRFAHRHRLQDASATPSLQVHHMNIAVHQRCPRRGSWHHIDWSA